MGRGEGWINVFAIVFGDKIQIAKRVGDGRVGVAGDITTICSGKKFYEFRIRNFIIWNEVKHSEP